MSLTFATEERGGTIVVHLSGRIDRDATTAFEEVAASTSAATDIELVFDDVDYINSTGIAIIVGLLARARSRRASVHATGLTAHYVHIFEITRLSDFIEIVQPADA
ncbi:STAS domain-containing protein [Amnibacterium sp.]|uniref:STAS domain-containing protein n=1 Tax=Amnibacterium sp. TaxID=1872496 RepID=UPI0026216C5E|nr:STAS domain-containing protein [Amnibacterium sp.]MCU1472888.1 Stage sporulation protein [Amnibacterium sp.]